MQPSNDNTEQSMRLEGPEMPTSSSSTSPSPASSAKSVLTSVPAVVQFGYTGYKLDAGRHTA